MTEYTHGIPGHILKGQFHSPNGGISAACWEVTIVGPEVEGVEHLRRVRDDAPAVRIDPRGRGYTALIPAESPPAGRTSYMTSGAYVEMGGGSLYEVAWVRLFGHRMPVGLHDYTETWAQYNSNFD
jgi:hypothetical protein